MKSRWSDADAKRMVKHYAGLGVSKDLALRVYTSRLLGSDPLLVMHGGGNTSVKTQMKDILGEMHDILCVKGSGWDMGDIEPQGLPAVKLEPLRLLRKLDALSDEDMVNSQRLNLLDASAPNPSVETLLHAFLPHKFVDHTHSTAILALVDQPDGEALIRKVYGKRVSIVPYIMPGFALAKAAAEVYEQDPSVEGLVLHKHGLFSFGENAKQSYKRTIDMVNQAEARLKKGRHKVFASAKLPKSMPSPAQIAPILRGACAEAASGADGDPQRMVLTFRTDAKILNYVNGKDVENYSQRGVVTPDHIIRTKNYPLVTPAPKPSELDAFAAETCKRVTRFQKQYDSYFKRENKKINNIKTKLDAMPRVVLVPGLGLFGAGKSAKDANIAADLAENTIRVITDAEAIGRYQPLSESDLFELEYWSLEQAKLAKAADKPLTRQVAVVTGGAGAIGRATAEALLSEGAAVALLDLDGAAAKAAANEIGALGLACDVTKRKSITQAFAKICEAYGGVDICVSNAGAAWQGRIGEVSDEILRKSFELNFFGHQNIAQEAVRIMTAQGTGGVLLFNVSKQAVNPGVDFGPYGLPKAATMFLVRQYAVDYGANGIRSNGVNADRIRSGVMTDDMIAERSKARGLSEQDYMGGNLLHREVLATDVAQSFVALAKATKTTGHIATVDGGNIAAALR